MKPTWPFLALAIGAFGIGTTEFAPMGLLPTIATGVGVSIPTAGLLVSAYAIGVMVGAPVMTLGLARMSRKSALILLMGIFTLGNMLSAIAPGYGLLLAARLITSFSHGAFFGLGALEAASLVPENRRASAVSTMFMGLTIANIGGVPAATWVGDTIGWRMAFAAIAGLGVIALAALALALPAGSGGEMPDVKRELRVLIRPAVVRALATTALGAGAMFTLYTYIAPVVTDLAHATPGYVTAMLVIIGVGFTVGNILSGRFADHSIEGTLIGCLALLTIVMVGYPFVATSIPGTAIMLLLWGAATFGAVAPLQMRVMQAAHDAPGLASSVNIGAFNLGNALGAAAGGAVISSGLGHAWVAPAGGLIAALGLILVLFGGRSSATGAKPATS